MLGNKSKSKESMSTSSNNSAPSGGLNSIVKGSSIEGTINAKSDIRVDGKIKGTLICEAKVIIGISGSIEGEVKCKNAVIEGKFEGTLKVDELLNVKEQAHINGDVSTGKLVVQPGAVFNVSCNMGGLKKATPSNTKNEGAKA